jgi:NhaP-type Na+/H+ or K+/H+ antiporter
MAVDVRYAVSAGIPVILLSASALCFRMLGVFLSLMGTGFNRKEKLFCMMAYTPKATVQAAVVSILLTAPFGAICVDTSYKKLLSRDEKN